MRAFVVYRVQCLQHLRVSGLRFRVQSLRFRLLGGLVTSDDTGFKIGMGPWHVSSITPLETVVWKLGSSMIKPP